MRMSKIDDSVAHAVFSIVIECQQVTLIVFDYGETLTAVPVPDGELVANFDVQLLANTADIEVSVGDPEASCRLSKPSITFFE